jgi:L-ribulose-5-phosphate 3-epimerase
VGMRIGYNTNGFGYHRLEDALDIIAELGYTAVGLTLDVHHLNPFTSTARDVAAVEARLSRLGLLPVIETGSRYLLDPRRKHRPTLIDDEPGPRVEFLRRSAQIARDLGAPVLSYWSGARPEGWAGDDAELYERLARGVAELEDLCRGFGVRAALEPEPGMLIERMADYDRLAGLLGLRPGLTLDVGHLECVEDEPEDVFPCRYADVLYSVQLDDMLPGRHRHLPFGEGSVDFGAVFRALHEIGYDGPACVELSEASRVAVETARESHEFLARYVGSNP